MGHPGDTRGRRSAAANDIYANPPEIEVLELEAGHPGLGDEGYIRRRRDLFAVCRAHRLSNQPPLLNSDYAALLTMIGCAAVQVKTGDHVLEQLVTRFGLPYVTP